jgi:coniferyl-aldehyde dehydrogenase
MTMLSTEETARGIDAILQKQRAAQLREGAPSREKRIDQLNKCIALLVDHSQALVEALDADFGARSRDASMLTDVVSSIGPLKFARDNLSRWMRPQARKPEAPFGLLGAKAEIRYQPKGVVGVIAPWNFPVNLTFTPLAGILAAGNRAMIKPSEYTPQTSELMKTLFAKYFSEEEIAVVTGGPEVGAAFAGLAFDHLIFTGSTSVAYHVMRAAADNLVPVTLELGGKSPVILGAGADITKTAARVMTGKTLNAGQICLAPDYVLAPKAQADAFVAAAQSAVAKMYPTIRDNPDYTAVISDRHYARLQELVRDAKEKGGEIITINPANEDLSQQPHRRMAPTLVLNPTDDMKVMQDEIFGPILPIKTVDSLGDAIKYVNAHPRPLAVYYFGEDKSEQERVLNETTSGGVTINDVIYHVAQEDLPFGGIGPSGMGAYHGREGFLEFSHKKAVYKQMKNDLLSIMRPPYGETFRKQVGARVKK